MIDSKMLMTVFKGSSAEQLIKYAKGFDTLILPNDKVKDSEKLIDMIADGLYDYVLGFGQRPNIKNKVHIETTAINGESAIETIFDCEALQRSFESNGIPAKISLNAGTSYCNCLYYNGLNYIQQNSLKTKMIFIHIPFLKNIDNIDLFFTRIINTISKTR
ncbi:MAG: hypothetical protein UH239_09320 [Acutalibacteraceae bacterium]|nr:hypothetical protein [Acutalibacteraceae bacterium]